MDVKKLVLQAHMDKTVTRCVNAQLRMKNVTLSLGNVPAYLVTTATVVTSSAQLVPTPHIAVKSVNVRMGDAVTQ